MTRGVSSASWQTDQNAKATGATASPRGTVQRPAGHPLSKPFLTSISNATAAKVSQTAGESPASRRRPMFPPIWSVLHQSGLTQDCKERRGSGLRRTHLQARPPGARRQAHPTSSSSSTGSSCTSTCCRCRSRLQPGSPHTARWRSRPTAQRPSRPSAGRPRRPATSAAAAAPLWVAPSPARGPDPARGEPSRGGSGPRTTAAWRRTGMGGPA